MKIRAVFSLTKNKLICLFKRTPVSRFLSAAAMIIGFGLIFSLVVSAASVIEIHDGAEVIRVVSARKDPTEIVRQAGIILDNDDNIDTSKFYSDSERIITINRAVDIKIINGDTVKEVTVNGKNVGDAIRSLGYSPDENDELTPPENTVLANGLTITYNSIEYYYRTTSEPIAYAVETAESAELYVGDTEVQTSGVNGREKLTYSSKYVNGVLQSEALVARMITVQPVNEIVLSGTKEKPVAVPSFDVEGSDVPAISVAGNTISWLTTPAWLQLDSNGAPASYSRILEGRATAYSFDAGTVTATGRKAMPGYIAVDPSIIPYGTEMYIVSSDGRYNYGYAIAADTGGFIRSGTILCDLFFGTTAECMSFGVRNVRIYIL